MSPTEFSNYIKQRQQMQQHNNHYHHQTQHQGMYGSSVSPSRSISPNPMGLQLTPGDISLHQQNPFVFPSNGFSLNMYQSFGSPRNMFEGLNGGNLSQLTGNNSSNDPLLYTPGACSSFADQQSSFCKIPNQQQQQNLQASLQASQQGPANNSNGIPMNINSSANGPQSQQQQENKLMDGINSFYNSSSNPSYQHLLVAN